MPSSRLLLASLLLALPANTAKAQAFEVLFSDNTGHNPRAGLVQDSDGNFYGTTYQGGATGYGTVFKLTASGTHTLLHSFNITTGGNPSAGLLLGGDGDFYGTTHQGGAGGSGTVFKITADGTHTLLHSFAGNDGRYPLASLTQGSDGDFYGVTSEGGANNRGTVFKITASGTHTVLHSFDNANGHLPSGSLVQGSDGDFYGITNTGGGSTRGTVFKITASGMHTVLHRFNSSNGSNPIGGLAQGSDGDFYGTTASGGASNLGTVFKITASGTHTVLHSFDGINGRHPDEGLVQGGDADFYGTTYSGGASGFGTVFKITASGTHTVLHSFDSTSGRNPSVKLVHGSDGNFYGATNFGGASGYGTVFRITADGAHTLLYSFNSINGSASKAGLVQGSDGDFYGTTEQGGTSGYGTVFKISPGGTYSVLHSFDNSNGSSPRAGLVQGSDGDFYGTTYSGGASGFGTVFKITASGTHTVLHSFDSTNGRRPWAGLTQGSDGFFYGTTYSGGASGFGTVFRITASGIHTVLHSFDGTYGINPRASLVQGSDGDLFGTTEWGGVMGYGTVFKITTDDTHEVLHSFYGVNGGHPIAGLVQGSDGDFYGTTTIGGAIGWGTVFRITANGTHTLLCSFNHANGRHPSAGLAQGSDGAFYGTTEYGGVNNLGTVFKITASGMHTVLYSFDGSQAVHPQCIAVFGSDGSLYGTANQMVVWRLNFTSQIALSGNGQEIENGDATPDAADHTDFGAVEQALGASTRTFTITNTGDLPLQLTSTPRVEISGTHAADFRVIAQPDSPVAAGESVAFTVAFDPSGAGVRSAMVSITSDASNAPLFTFAIRGTGTGEADTKNPTLKLATPAGKTVSASSPLTVAGVAGDGFAVDRVEVALNGGEVVLAELGASSKPSAVPFSAQIVPVIGENTLTVTAFDPSGNSTSTTRVFTFERRHVLTLVREVPTALTTMPDKAGTLALKAAIAKNATALTKGSPQTSQVLPDTMLTLTAEAKTGHLFSHWTGLPEGAQVRGNVAAFMMPAAEVSVTAVFVANPLTQGAMAALGSKPVFQGLLRPDEATPPGNDTAGFLSAALVPAKGSLSGKLWMDGLVIPFTGALHGDGSVWFKAGKIMSSTLPFAGRELAMTWDESGLNMTVTRAVNEVNHVSTGQAKPPLHSKTTPVRGTLLDAKGRQGYFTLALTAVEQDPVKPAAEYPQGSGHAGFTLLANGTLKLAGTLAEGTKITAASFLVEGDAAEVFIVLPTPGGKTKAGSLLGTLVFDEAQADVTSDDMQWFRPEAQTKAGVAQAYRAGWPGGIALGVLGALYDGSVPVQTTLGLDMTTTDGNVALIFQDGKLLEEVSVNFNLEGSKVVKLDAKDKTWSLKLTPKTGLMSGAFTPNWPDAVKKPPVFSGVLLQKGANAGGRGFFLSNAAGDTEPESGAVELGAP